MTPEHLREVLGALRAWVEESREPYSDAMALATASPEGAPSVRMVSLRGVEDNGVRFFTGYESRKARELGENPRAAALFFFRERRRQVRLEGIVRRLPAHVSDAYFASRSREHRVSTIAWVQGRRVGDMRELHRAREAARERIAQRPLHWGGYLLEVEAAELWFGGENRMHERWRFERDERFMLAP